MLRGRKFLSVVLVMTMLIQLFVPFASYANSTSETETGIDIGVDIDEWLVDEDGGVIYAVSSEDNELYIIDLDTFGIEKTIEMNGYPTDLDLYDGKLYISLWKGKEISIIDLDTFDEIRFSTSSDPYRLVAYEDKVIYAEYDQHCYIYELDTSTGIDSKLKTGSMYFPDLVIDHESKVLYIGESSSSSSELLAFSLIDHSRVYKSDTYDAVSNGSTRRVVLVNNQEVFYNSRSITVDEDAVVNGIYGTVIRSVNEKYAVSDECVYNRKTFLPVASIENYPSKIEILINNDLVIYDKNTQTIKTVSVHDLEDYSENQATTKSDIKFEDWIIDEIREEIFAISRENNKLYKLDLNTFEILSEIFIGSKPGDIDMYGNSIYVSYDGSTRVTEIDVKTFQVVQEIYTPDYVRQIAVTNNEIFMSMGSYVYRFDRDTTQFERLPSFANNRCLAVDREEGILYAWSRRLDAYSIDDNELIFDYSAYRGKYDENGVTRLVFDSSERIFGGTSFVFDGEIVVQGTYADSITSINEDYAVSSSKVYNRSNFTPVASLPEGTHEARILKDNTVVMYGENASQLKRMQVSSLEDYSENEPAKIGKTEISEWVFDEASGSVYAISATDNKLLQVDYETNTVIKEVYTGSRPVDFDIYDGKIYVALMGRPVITVFDKESFDKLPEIDLGRYLERIAVHGNTIIYSDSYEYVYKFDSSSGITSEIAKYINEPDMIIDDDGDKVYIGESRISSSEFIVYSILNEEVICKASSYDEVSAGFADRKIIVEDSEIFYNGRSITLDENLVVNGRYYDTILAVNDTYAVSNSKVYDRQNFVQVATLSEGIEDINYLENGNWLTYDNESFKVIDVESLDDFDSNTKTVLGDVELTDWIVDEANKCVYAISSSANKLFLIDIETLSIEKEIFIGSAPSSLDIDDGKIYISLAGAMKIMVVDQDSFDVLEKLSAESFSKQVAVNGDTLVYSDDDSYIYRLNMSSGESTRFLFGVNDPDLVIDKDTNILYIGESMISSSEMLLYSLDDNKVIYDTNYYDPITTGYAEKKIMVDQSEIFFNGRSISYGDDVVVNGTYDSTALSVNDKYVATSDGLFSRKGFNKIFSFDSASLVHLFKDNSLLIQSKDTNEVKIITPDLDGENGPNYANLFDELILDTKLTAWTYDDEVNRIFAISKESNMLFEINPDSKEVVNEIEIGSRPTDIAIDNGKIYVPLSGATRIAVVDKYNCNLQAPVDLRQSPYKIETDNDQIFYSENDTSGRVYAIGVTSESAITVSGYIRYAELLTDNKNDILYVGGTHYHDNELMTFSTVNHSYLSSAPDYTLYGDNIRRMMIDNDTLYYRKYALDPKDLSIIKGEYDSSVIYAKNGHVFTKSGYYKNSFSKEFEMDDPTDVLMNNDGNLFLYYELDDFDGSYIKFYDSVEQKGAEAPEIQEMLVDPVSKSVELEYKAVSGSAITAIYADVVDSDDEAHMVFINNISPSAITVDTVMNASLSYTIDDNIASFGDYDVEISESNKDVLIDYNDRTYYGSTYTLKTPIYFSATANVAGQVSAFGDAVYIEELLVGDLMSTDARLDHIILNPGANKLNFDDETFGYTMDVEEWVEQAEIQAVTSHEGASVTINGIDGSEAVIPLSYGQQYIEVVVTAEDEKTTETYTLTINRKGDGLPSNDAGLSGISVSEGKMTPAFSKEIVEYDVTVDESVEKLTITALKTHSKAAVMINGREGQEYTIDLSYGENDVDIVVTAEDGKTQSHYSMTIERERPVSTKLHNLTVTSGSLSPRFSSGTFNYTVNVSYDVKRVTINAVKEDQRATVTINNKNTTNEIVGLNVGSNVHRVKISNDQGQSNTYTITIKRAEEDKKSSGSSGGSKGGSGGSGGGSGGGFGSGDEVVETKSAEKLKADEAKKHIKAIKPDQDPEKARAAAKETLKEIEAFMKMDKADVDDKIEVAAAFFNVLTVDMLDGESGVSEQDDVDTPEGNSDLAIGEDISNLVENIYKEVGQVTPVVSQVNGKQMVSVLDATQQIAKISETSKMLMKSFESDELRQYAENVERAISLPVQSIKDAEISISDSVLKDLQSQDVDVRIESENMNFVLPNDFSQAADNKNVKVLMSVVDENIAAGNDKTIIGEVYDLDVYSDDQKVTEFSNMPVLEFSVGNVSDLNNLNVFVYDEELSRWEFVKTIVDNGMIKAQAPHFSKYAVQEWNKPFTDIQDHWAESFIREMGMRELVGGYSDGSFKPQSTITRAEVAQLISNVLDLSYEEDGVIPSIESDAWYFDAVNAAAQKDMILNSEQYDPNGFATREEIAFMVAKAFEIKHDAKSVYPPAPFMDIRELPEEVKDAIALTYNENIISGYPDYTFRGEALATRAEVITMMINLINQ